MGARKSGHLSFVLVLSKPVLVLAIDREPVVAGALN